MPTQTVEITPTEAQTQSLRLSEEMADAEAPTSRSFNCKASANAPTLCRLRFANVALSGEVTGEADTKEESSVSLSDGDITGDGEPLVGALARGATGDVLRSERSLLGEAWRRARSGKDFGERGERGVLGFGFGRLGDARSHTPSRLTGQEMSGNVRRGTVRRGKVRRGKVRRGMDGKVSVGQNVRIATRLRVARASNLGGSS